MTSVQEIEQIATLIKTLIEKLEDNTKISRLDELKNEIKNTPNLHHLFNDDLDVCYQCSLLSSCSKFNHLQKCVIMTSNYKFLEEYIDLYLDEHPTSINYQNERGWTALMLAARNSNCTSTERTVEILLKHNADVNFINKPGWTAVMYASKNSGKYSTEGTVKLLLEKNADINIENDGMSALRYALKFYKTLSTLNTVKMLLEKMDNCDVIFKETKLIKYLWDEKLPNEIISLVVEKGAKLSDICDQRSIDLMKYIFTTSKLTSKDLCDDMFKIPEKINRTDLINQIKYALDQGDYIKGEKPRCEWVINFLSFIKATDAIKVVGSEKWKRTVFQKYNDLLHEPLFVQNAPEELKNYFKNLY